MKQYHINEANELAQLEKQAKFKYINQYRCYKGKRFKKLFKHPAFQKFLNKNPLPPVVIAEIAILGKKGFGVVATEDLLIKKGNDTRPLGVYWGKLTNEGAHSSNYVFVVSKYEIDAAKTGNWTRFVNHSKGNFNVIATDKSVKIGHIRLPYIEYALIRDVKAGEQLLVDYGPDYEFDPKHQIFLNPSNSHVPVADLYKKHRAHYVLLKGKVLTACQTLMPKAKKLYGPRHVRHGDLPILVADQRGKLLPDRKQPGMTALLLAAYTGNMKAAQALLRLESVNIDQENTQNGCNALFYAIQSNAKPAIKKRMVNLLLNAGINLETQDKVGNNALHWCVKQNDIALWNTILANKNAKDDIKPMLSMRDREGRTPIARP